MTQNLLENLALVSSLQLFNYALILKIIDTHQVEKKYM